MPLRDHFHSPFKDKCPWEGMHSAWANAMVLQLNEQTLPPDYQAIPRTHLGARVEVDVATVHDEEMTQQMEINGSVAVWSPPRAHLAADVTFTDRDTFEVQVRQGEGRELVAAVELVSPANKDRPSSWRDFAVKCASYLQQRVALVVIDVVTERRDNLHQELMQFLEMPEEFIEAKPPALYGVSYRIRRRDDSGHRLELWTEALALDAELPMLPLWIAEEQAVPLDLEASYQAALHGLRIR